MSTYELVTVTLSVAAIGVSLWTFHRQQKAGAALRKLEEEAKRLEVVRAMADEEWRTRARLVAELPTHEDALAVRNGGGATAYAIRVDVRLPEHPGLDVAEQSRHRGLLKREELESGERHRIPLLLSRENMRPPLEVVVSWSDAKGEQTRTQRLPL